MKKIAILATSIVAALVAGMLISTPAFVGADVSEQAAKSKNKVSETVVLPDDLTLNQFEVLVLLDTTGSGKLRTVHVAANLPCGAGPTAGAGNDTPDVSIVAGVAGSFVGFVIDQTSTSQDTGFNGPNSTCVFHETVSTPFPGIDSASLPAIVPGTVESITDVILVNAGADPVTLPAGTTITITGSYRN